MTYKFYLNNKSAYLPPEKRKIKTTLPTFCNHLISMIDIVCSCCDSVFLTTLEPCMRKTAKDRVLSCEHPDGSLHKTYIRLKAKEGS